MTILGIDPGTRTTGYGIIRVGYCALTVLDYGAIRPPGSHSLSKRCLAIFQGIALLLEKYPVDVVVTESPFVGLNAQSALKLGMAKGVAMLPASQKNIPLYEYAPRKVKQSVVSYGNASKAQVQRMLQTLLQLPELPTPEDAADALALALCHSHHINDLPDVRVH